MRTELEPLREVVAAHLNRPLCHEAVREVEVRVLSAGSPRVVLQVGHAWRLSEGRCSSLFTVLPGGPLSATTVLMRERPFDPSPEIWVRPATSPRAIPISGDRVEQHVLGTDFTYDDLRFWTPRAVTAATSWATGEGGVTLWSAWRFRGHLPVTAESRLGADGLLSEIVLTAGGRPLRSLRIDDVITAHGMRTPLTMSATRPLEEFESRMRLLRMRGGAGLPAELFEPSRLEEAGTAVAVAVRAAGEPVQARGSR